MKIKARLIFTFISLATLIFFFNSCKSSEHIIQVPGQYKDVTLLPNGWKLTPAGKQIKIGELPLNLKVTKDEKYAITSNNGVADNSISVINLREMKEVQRISLDKTWRGVAFNQDDSKLYASGGNNNLVYILNFNSGNLSLVDSIEIGRKDTHENISVTGLDYVPGKNYLLVVSRESNSL